MKRNERKKMRVQEAEERLARWRALTPEQRLAELDKRRGNSAKQKARIKASM